MRRVALGLVAAVVLANLGSAMTAANSVPASRSDLLQQAVTANDLKPDACAALNLTAIVLNGAGTGANELLLGTSGVDSLTGAGGNDCLVGGDGADTLSGGSGTDVCIGGAGSDSYPDGSCETIVDDPTCSPSSSTLTAIADTEVDIRNPTDINGTLTTMDVRPEASRERRALVKFTLPAIPTGCALTAATLRLNATTFQAATLRAVRAGASWLEATASGNVMPGPAGTGTTATAALGWVQWDVLSHVRGMYQEQDYGFIVKDSNDGGAGGTVTNIFATREHATTTIRPQLVLTFGSGSSADTVVPLAMDTETVNNGSIVGRPELGDVLTLRFSEPMAPASILAGWSGAATNVVVRGTNSGSADVLTVFNSANTVQVPLGTFRGGDLLSANNTFGATGTPSVMTMTGSALTITLGTPSGGTRTGAAVRATWTPVAGPTDTVGNALDLAVATESGGSDASF